MGETIEVRNGVRREHMVLESDHAFPSFWGARSFAAGVDGAVVWASSGSDGSLLSRIKENKIEGSRSTLLAI